MFRLDGKVALITGAAGGIGAGIAEAMARQGADIAVCDRPGVSLDETVAKVTALGRKAFGVEIDVSDLDMISKGIEEIRKAFGRVDILVNNAGISKPTPALEMTEEIWDAHYDIHVKGGFFMAQKVAPMMIENRWGRIIWLSSQTGFVAVRNQCAYGSSKGAIVALVRLMGVEFAVHGITVNAIAPTFVDTAMVRKRLEDPEYYKYVMSKLPGKKLATIEQIAAAAVYLASEEAAMVNCETLRVDGGWTAW
ncbi:MAG: SDR family oxidoreductase [Peptococcaceae bacterium]|nr:SDR family oxidoreductase [Peptococcaceae bacterium]